MKILDFFKRTVIFAGIFFVIFAVDLIFVTPHYTSSPLIAGAFAKAAFWVLIVAIYTKKVPMKKRVIGGLMAWVASIILKVALFIATRRWGVSFLTLYTALPNMILTMVIEPLPTIIPAWVLYKDLNKSRGIPITVLSEDKSWPIQDLSTSEEDKERLIEETGKWA